MILEECLSEAGPEQAAVGRMICQHEGIPALASLSLCSASVACVSGKKVKCFHHKMKS